MNKKQKNLLVALFIVIMPASAYPQGYIVPNGVLTNYSGAFLPGEISVIRDPANLYYTGFNLLPLGKTSVTTLYTNIFKFDALVDVGVRVFLVNSNAPISLQPILSQSWVELTTSQSAGYIFTNASPFYLALFTGTGNFAAPDGIYTDPLFGWVKLVNNRGTIQLLDGVIEYGGVGIYAGTQNVIAVPEPTTLVFVGLGGLGLALACKRRSCS